MCNLPIVINSVVGPSVVVISVVGEVFVDIINVVVVVVLLLIKVPTRAAAIAIPRSRAASRDTITCRYEHPQPCFAKHLQQICVDCAKKTTTYDRVLFVFLFRLFR